MNTAKYISELLYHHECVIVPGFGGFVGNYSPAKIHPVQHSFHPPFKSLLFNINLKQNDGLLANHIAGRENISFLEAMKSISTIVESWRQLLREGNPVVLERIGRFWLDKEGIIQFEQNPEVNYLPESFGLSPFISPAIRRIGLQKKMERRITRYIDSSAGYRRSIPKALKWAAILALPVGLAAFMGVTKFDRIRDLTQTYSGMIFTKPLPLVYHSLAPGKESSTLQPGKYFQVTSVPVISHPAPVISMPDESSGRTVQPYSIIVGAFLVKENADKLVDRLKSEGFNAFIIDVTKGGLHRVCLQSFSDRNQAIQQLAAIRSEKFASAWLLQK